MPLRTNLRLSTDEVVSSSYGRASSRRPSGPQKRVKVEPVRHRRVRTYLFVCGLAYRLEVALRWKLLEGGFKPEDLGEYQERLLEELGRGERPELQLGAQSRTWHPNVTERVREACFDSKRGLCWPRVDDRVTATDVSAKGLRSSGYNVGVLIHEIFKHRIDPGLLSVSLVPSLGSPSDPLALRVHHRPVTTPRLCGESHSRWSRAMRPDSKLRRLGHNRSMALEAGSAKSKSQWERKG